jgi:hypothetical protein
VKVVDSAAMPNSKNRHYQGTFLALFGKKCQELLEKREAEPVKSCKFG